MSFRTDFPPKRTIHWVPLILILRIRLRERDHLGKEVLRSILHAAGLVLLTIRNQIRKPICSFFGSCV